MSTVRSDPKPWAIVTLLLALVLVPTAGVVWFMAAAVGNERAAAREAVAESHRSRLEGSARRVSSEWERRRAVLDEAPRGEPAETFAALVRAGVAQSFIVYDESGVVLYPADGDGGAVEQPVASRPNTSPAWSNAQRLEFSSARPLEAAQAYATIAATERDVDLVALALRAHARSLGKAGRIEEAVTVLLDELAAEDYISARDPQGRLIAPDGLLVALHLIGDPADKRAVRAAGLLRNRLEHYGEPRMPLAQRRFLMRQLANLRPEEAPVDTYRAEELAEEYLTAEPASTGRSEMSASPIPGIWQLPSSDGRVVSLLAEGEVVDASLGNVEIDSDQGRFELLPPGLEPTDEPFLVTAIGGILPGWRLALHLDDQALVAAVARQEVAGYLWTGILLIAAALLLAVVVAVTIRRQMRLAKLKNDLVATVTHELKTPLASMRLLVDTLLDGERHDERQVREYLELLSSENERLSRLIDDFLAFSRMERNKQAFEKVELKPEAVVRSASEAVRPRFEDGGCDFAVDVDRDMPTIVGDPEALSTVLVNLLDNAYKYSREDKRIRLRAYGENESVVFDVEDNGVGLSRRAAKRVFDRFYQVDDSLSRQGSGVGLGLSIVRFIVDAHQGEVSVASEPGEGSIFRVRVPIASPETMGA